MDILANKISRAIKQADPERTYSVEVMQYSLSILLNTLLVILVSLCIGWVTGSFQSTVITICSLTLLRLSSGGFHMKTAWGCNIVSILIFAIIPQIPSFPVLTLHILNFLNLLIMILFAPNPDQNTQIPKKIYPTLKVLSIFLACSNFVIGSEVVALAFFAQSLTIIPWRKEVKP